jgi:glycosyltransferase involved in cell wall biosynthesis
MKKCSIIIPIYKGKDYIDECLKSIVNQTYSNWELIIMDDGSPDDSYDYISKIIEDYQDYDIRLLRQENRGVAETRNGCVLLANGEYITFIDQDDTIAEDYLERLMSAAEEACADIALCGYARKTNETKADNLRSVDFFKSSNGDGSIRLGARITSDGIASDGV